MYQTLGTSHGHIIQVLIGPATGVVRRDIAERFMGETFSVGDIPSIEGMVSRELLKNLDVSLQGLSSPSGNPQHPSGATLCTPQLLSGCRVHSWVGIL